MSAAISSMRVWMSSYAYGPSSGTDLGSGSAGSDDPMNPTYRLMVPIGSITAWVVGEIAGT